MNKLLLKWAFSTVKKEIKSNSRAYAAWKYEVQSDFVDLVVGNRKGLMGVPEVHNLASTAADRFLRRFINEEESG